MSSQVHSTTFYDPCQEHLACHLQLELKLCNMGDLHVCKTAVTNPDTLSYDKALCDINVDKWKEAANLEILALEEKGIWDEVPVSDAKPKIVPGTWSSTTSALPQGRSRSTRVTTVSMGISKKGSMTPTHLSSLGAPFGSCWLLPSPKYGNSSAWRSTTHLFSQSLQNPSGYTFLMGIDQSSQVPHAFATNVVFMAPLLTLGSSS